jgi:ABC-2 type transport system permease protein
VNAVALIARRELVAYLRSPAGWVIAGILLLVDGIIFNAIAVGADPKKSAEVLEDFLLYAGGMTAITAILLSMRQIAEERQSGSIVLLFTAPVRETQIVLAKFLSAYAFLIILVLLTLYLPALIFVNGKVSVGHIAAGYLGMILLGGAALAIGMLGSAIAPNQLLALVIAGGVLAFMHFVFWVAQITEGELHSVLEYLSIYVKHFMPFRRGLLQLSDVVYYASVMWFGLLGATRVLQSRRWR